MRSKENPIHLLSKSDHEIIIEVDCQYPRYLWAFKHGDCNALSDEKNKYEESIIGLVTCYKEHRSKIVEAFDYFQLNKLNIRPDCEADKVLKLLTHKVKVTENHIGLHRSEGVEKCMKIIRQMAEALSIMHAHRECYVNFGLQLDDSESWDKRHEIVNKIRGQIKADLIHNSEMAIQNILEDAYKNLHTYCNSVIPSMEIDESMSAIENSAVLSYLILLPLSNAGVQLNLDCFVDPTISDASERIKVNKDRLILFFSPGAVKLMYRLSNGVATHTREEYQERSCMESVFNGNLKQHQLLYLFMNARGAGSAFATAMEIAEFKCEVMLRKLVVYLLRIPDEQELSDRDHYRNTSREIVSERLNTHNYIVPNLLVGFLLEGRNFIKSVLREGLEEKDLLSFLRYMKKSIVFGLESRKVKAELMRAIFESGNLRALELIFGVNPANLHSNENEFFDKKRMENLFLDDGGSYLASAIMSLEINDEKQLIMFRTVLAFSNNKNKSAEGVKPLFLAASIGNFDMMKELLVYPSVRDTLLGKDNNGKTILMHFAESTCADMLRQLVVYLLAFPGAKELLSEKDNDGNTLLHILCGRLNKKDADALDLLVNMRVCQPLYGELLFLICQNIDTKDASNYETRLSIFKKMLAYTTDFSAEDSNERNLFQFVVSLGAREFIDALSDSDKAYNQCFSTQDQVKMTFDNLFQSLKKSLTCDNLAILCQLLSDKDIMVNRAVIDEDGFLLHMVSQLLYVNNQEPKAKDYDEKNQSLLLLAQRLLDAGEFVDYTKNYHNTYSYFNKVECARELADSLTVYRNREFNKPSVNEAVSVALAPSQNARPEEATAPHQALIGLVEQHKNSIDSLFFLKRDLLTALENCLLPQQGQRTNSKKSMFESWLFRRNNEVSEHQRISQDIRSCYAKFRLDLQHFMITINSAKDVDSLLCACKNVVAMTNRVQSGSRVLSVKLLNEHTERSVLKIVEKIRLTRFSLYLSVNDCNVILSLYDASVINSMKKVFSSQSLNDIASNASSLCLEALRNIVRAASAEKKGYQERIASSANTVDHQAVFAYLADPSNQERRLYKYICQFLQENYNNIPVAKSLAL